MRAQLYPGMSATRHDSLTMHAEISHGSPRARARIISLSHYPAFVGLARDDNRAISVREAFFLRSGNVRDFEIRSLSPPGRPRLYTMARSKAGKPRRGRVKRCGRGVTTIYRTAKEFISRRWIYYRWRWPSLIVSTIPGEAERPKETLGAYQVAAIFLGGRCGRVHFHVDHVEPSTE